MTAPVKRDRVLTDPHRVSWTLHTVDTGRGLSDSYSGYWVLDTGYWILDTGYWVLDAGYWIVGNGYWILDTGYWVLVTGYWIHDT